MNNNNIIQKFKNVIEYARKEKIRLLIEIDSDFGRAHVYTDRMTFSKIKKSLIENAVNMHLKLTLSDHKMYYNKNHELIILGYVKKIKYRFYNTKVDCSSSILDKLVHFVSLKGEFSQDVKTKLIGLGSQQIIEFAKNNEGYDYNEIQDDTVIIYQLQREVL